MLEDSRYSIILFAVMTVFSGSLCAEGSVGEEGLSEVTETIVVTGVRQEEIPAGAHTLSAEDIRDTNYQDFTDLLRRVPGVAATSFGQGDIGSPIAMRGFGSGGHGSNVAVYVDGVQQNMPSAAQGGHGTSDLSWLAPDMIERIEVIKGPFSPLYGDQARAGVINIITHGAEAPSALSASVARFGYVRTGGSLSLPLGDGSKLLTAMELYHRDGYRDHSGTQRGSLMAKYSKSLSEGGEIAVRGHYYRSDWDAPGYLSFAGLTSGDLRPGQADPNNPLLGGEAERYGAVLTWRSSETYGWQATAFAEHYDKTRRNGNGLSPPRHNVQNDDRDIFGARILHDIPIGEQLLLTVGADTRLDRGDASNRRFEEGQATELFTSFWQLDLLTYGIFLQAQFALTPELSLTAGLRHDEFDYDIDNLKLPDASTSYSATITKPRIGLSYTPIESLELFANFGQGFRSVSATELSPPVGGVQPLGTSGGEPIHGLKPPTVEALDIGFRASLSEQWQLGGVIFHSTNDNEIREEPSGSGVFMPIGDTRRDGYEIDGEYTIFEGFGLHVSYGHIRARLENPSIPGRTMVTGQAKHTVKLGGSYRLPLQQGNLNATFDYQYLAGRHYYVAGSNDPLRAKDHARYDMRLSYELGAATYSAWLTWQPLEFAAEYTGASINPPPRLDAGLSYSYKF